MEKPKLKDGDSIIIHVPDLFYIVENKKGTLSWKEGKFENGSYCPRLMGQYVEEGFNSKFEEVLRIKISMDVFIPGRTDSYYDFEIPSRCISEIKKIIPIESELKLEMYKYIYEDLQNGN